LNDVTRRRIIQELSPDGGGEHRFVHQYGEQINMADLDQLIGPVSSTS
jgi:hypothetical protein